MLKKKLNLTDKGYANLKQAIVACTVSNLALFLPFVVLIQVIITMIEPLISNEPLNTIRLWLLFGASLFAAFIYFIAYRREYRKTYTTAYNEAMDTRIEVAERMRKLPMSYFNQHNLSDLTTNLMANCASIEHVMSHLVPQIMGYSISCIIASVMMAFYDWRMALTIFSVLPLALLVVYISQIIEKKFSRQHVAAKLAVSDQVQEYLEGIKIIKAFGLAGEKFKNLEKSLKNMQDTAIRFELIAGLFATSSIVLLQAGIGLTVLVGVTLVANGSLQILAFLTFLLVSVRIYNPLIAIMTMLPEFFYLLISLEQMQKLRKTDLMTGNSDVKFDNFTIEFEQVNFGYNSDVDVIKDISLTIEQNSVTALVGPSGCGKSTLSKLIARFWDVKSGTIRLGGHNIAQVDPDTIMRNISFVFQDVILFNDTILNNIRLGKPDATEEEVYTAARRARCDEFIQCLPDGYNTILSENGSTLSGGQRQRISIARALLKDAPIILLDEATASLDPENEVYIQDAISELLQNRTVIVIAHRLRTITHADQIIVLQEGRVAESGDFATLMDKKGMFHHLYTLQQQSLGWRL